MYVSIPLHTFKILTQIRASGTRYSNPFVPSAKPLERSAGDETNNGELKARGSSSMAGKLFNAVDKPSRGANEQKMRA